VFPTQAHEPDHPLDEHLRRRVEGHALHIRTEPVEHRNELPDRTQSHLPAVEPYLPEAEEHLGLLLGAEDRQHFLATGEAQGEKLQPAVLVASDQPVHRSMVPS
jgi:hypothetical protein